MILITIWIIYNLVMPIFFKRNLHIVQCGLGAFSSKINLSTEQKRKVWQNMKMIGLALEERGKDSCGLYMNGILTKGFDGTKEQGDTSKFKDFIAKHRDLKYEGGAILIHTRSSTIGAHTEGNC